MPGEFDDGDALVGRRVWVQGGANGAGDVVAFSKQLIARDKHLIRFDWTQHEPGQHEPGSATNFDGAAAAAARCRLQPLLVPARASA